VGRCEGTYSIGGPLICRHQRLMLGQNRGNEGRDLDRRKSNGLCVGMEVDFCLCVVVVGCCSFIWGRFRCKCGRVRYAVGARMCGHGYRE
jgi:hypothetical protein